MSVPDEATAEQFVAALHERRGPADVERSRAWFRTDDEFIGVRMGEVFRLAKDFVDMPPGEIDTLLDSAIHEVRVGAVSIMGKQAVRRRTPEARRRELFELYLARTDRINTWDLVDVSAHQVVGGYLRDKDRAPLYRLASSGNWWERRIAVFATLWFVRAGELDDTFTLAELLLDEPHDRCRRSSEG